VPSTLRESISESLGAFRAVLGNRDLRLVESAGAFAETGKWLYIVALAVYAYGVGGATAVGVVALIRIIPSAIAAPFIAVLADRFPREQVMLQTAFLRTLALGFAAAAVALDMPAGLIYGLAGLVTLLSTAFRPAESALLPTLAQTPQELTAANVAASTIASIGSFVGPAVGGLLLVATNVETVFAVTAGMFLVATVLVALLRVPRVRERGPMRAGFARESFAGFSTIFRDRNLRVLITLYGAQTTVAGALAVLIVVAAIELLDIGEAGVGYLNSAFGVGGLIGAALTLVLVARQRLASDFAIGMFLWGIPLIVAGLWTEPAVAFVLFALIGVGDVLIEVAAPTLLQRAVPDEVLARVFGAVESILIGTMGLGSILAPVLVDALGTRGALIATGAFLPVLAILFWARLRTIDREATVPVHEIELLRRISIFAPLPPPRIEELASRLVLQNLPAGTVVFAQGDSGDRFYVIDEGEVEVAIDGKHVRNQSPGEYFGEIALLRDVPRTATVVTAVDTKLYSLDRDEFLGAVTGHTDSRDAADTVVGARLAAAKPPGLVLE
jgi:MFS family permease